MVMNDMTDDGKWGAEIAVDGVRPEWLKQSDVINIKTQFGWVAEHNGVFDKVSAPIADWAWMHSDGKTLNILAIRLLASHPHYQQTQPIDWSAPIEAVHEDGRVVPVCLGGNGDNPDAQGDHYTLPVLPGCTGTGVWKVNGLPWMNMDKGWRIRNVQPATGIPVTAQTLTAQEHLARMEALVRKIATYTSREHHTSELLIAADEARALVAEMEPVDADLIEARRIEHDILVEHEMDGTPALRGEWDDKPGVRGVLRAIRRGRELARGDVA